jgi:hypothetical protein
MNNRQTNRRRGRGNNRTQNNNRNGYDNQNRVDNRARGNAAQMLEKYKKLAQDAQHNGDRVNAEYYLQFADHYFRVLADYRSRQEESRPQREWRGDDGEGSNWRDEERDTQDEGEEAEAVAEQGNEEDDYRRPQRQERDDRSSRNDRGDRGECNDRNARNRNNNNRRDRYEPREDRSVAEDIGLDHSILPPAIGAANDEEPVAEAKPARKPRAPRKPKATGDADMVAAAE